MKKEFLTTSPTQTKKIGQNLALKILKSRLRKKAYIVSLVGDLGGGKTTFLQGFAKGLGIREKVLSPTFIILRHFELRTSLCGTVGHFEHFYHIDCYRIQNPRELLSLGFKEIISDSQNIVAIEWADRIKKIMPPGAICINFEFIDNKTRKIVLKLKDGK